MGAQADALRPKSTMAQYWHPFVIQPCTFFGASDEGMNRYNVLTNVHYLLKSMQPKAYTQPLCFFFFILVCYYNDGVREVAGNGDSSVRCDDGGWSPAARLWPSIFEGDAQWPEILENHVKFFQFFILDKWCLRQCCIHFDPMLSDPEACILLQI